MGCRRRPTVGEGAICAVGSEESLCQPLHALIGPERPAAAAETPFASVSSRRRPAQLASNASHDAEEGSCTYHSHNPVCPEAVQLSGEVELRSVNRVSRDGRGHGASRVRS